MIELRQGKKKNSISERNVTEEKQSNTISNYA